jgi:hypothetical protein
MFGFDRFVKHFAMGGFSSGLSALFAPGCSAFNCTTGSGNAEAKRPQSLRRRRSRCPPAFLRRCARALLVAHRPRPSSPVPVNRRRRHVPEQPLPAPPIRADRPVHRVQDLGDHEGGQGARRHALRLRCLRQHGAGGRHRVVCRKSLQTPKP